MTLAATTSPAELSTTDETCVSDVEGGRDSNLQAAEPSALAALATASGMEDEAGLHRERYPIDLSVVIAAYNEVESIPELFEELRNVLEASSYTWEIVLVDDGSTDGSRRIERRLHSLEPRFRVVQFRRNFGKAAALDAGFRRVRGRFVVTMDADLQDVPAEMHKLLDPVVRGDADLVSGWKWPRLDPWSKRMPSRLYNLVGRFTTGLDLHDMNCGFKAYRAEVVEELHLYGSMHRYIPVIAQGAGFVVDEVKVAHRARSYGHSKYAAGRFVRGFLDLVTVLFLTRYERRPLHLIGGLGIVLGSTGFLILLYLTGLWFYGEPIGGRPLLLLGVLLLVVAGQFFTFGLLAEMMTYHSQRHHPGYPLVAELGFEPSNENE